jgi:hypothetical protein
MFRASAKVCAGLGQQPVAANPAAAVQQKHNRFSIAHPFYVQ